MARCGRSRGGLLSNISRFALSSISKFALKHLKDFGFGKAGLEGVIQEEAEDIVKHLATFHLQDFE